MKRYNMGLEVRDNLRTHQDDWTDNSGPAAFIVALESKNGKFVTYNDHIIEMKKVMDMIIHVNPAEVEQFLLKYKDLQP